MYRILVAYRAGVESSLILKIEMSQVIEEYGLSIEIKHTNLGGVPGSGGDGTFMPSNVTTELKAEYSKRYIVGIQSIVDEVSLLKEMQILLKAKEGKQKG